MTRREIDIMLQCLHGTLTEAQEDVIFDQILQLSIHDREVLYASCPYLSERLYTKLSQHNYEMRGLKYY